jgi:hypothetical protein
MSVTPARQRQLKKTTCAALKLVLAAAALLLWTPGNGSQAQQEPSRQLVQTSGTQANVGRRVALVIGNGAYTNAPSLKNPPNDARDMAATLAALGFEVSSGVNLSQRDMKRLIREFGQKLKAGGNGLFYYAGHGVQAKSQEEGSRQIVLEEFTKARPAAATAKAQTPARTRSRKPMAAVRLKGPRYTRKTPSVIADLQPGSATMDIGVTIWRLRPSAGNESGARVLVMENAQSSQWTPQRIEADTPLQVGERVRISIESPRAGYLYVIDREQYADGSLGDAYLIFPTLRTRGGDNRVQPGRLIDIPAQEDNPSYFTLVPSPSRTDQVAEVLTILVTPEPLEDLHLTNNALKLSKGDVAKWERSWSREVERFEMVGGAGKAWTNAEKEAGSMGSARVLTQEEPAPQTVFRVASKSKNTFLVTVPLRYGR